jgi:hypothetical protein
VPRPVWLLVRRREGRGSDPRPSLPNNGPAARPHMWGATPCIKISIGLRLGWQMVPSTGAMWSSAACRRLAGQGGPRHTGHPAWLGHRSITSTAVYTALAPNRFKDFWRDDQKGCTVTNTS